MIGLLRAVVAAIIEYRTSPPSTDPDMVVDVVRHALSGLPYEERQRVVDILWIEALDEYRKVAEAMRQEPLGGVQ